MSFSASVENLVADSSDPLVGKADWWERVPLDDVFGILNGFPFKSALFNKQKGFPVIRIRDITSGEISTYYDGPAEEDYWIEKGDLVVGMDGDFNSRKWQADRALLNQRCCKVYRKSTLYDYDFLSFVLPGYLKLINEETHSITVKHLSSRTISEIPLPLPPLNEQRRIVTKLEGILAKVQSAQARLDKIPDLLKRTRQAILSAAVSGKLTEDWREENNLQSKAQSIKPEIIPFELPNGWCWSSFKHLGELNRGKSKHRPRNDERLFGGEYPFIQTGDVANSGGKITSHKTTYSEFGLAQSRLGRVMN